MAVLRSVTKHYHMRHVTRFAPSPTGPLHKGHAYAALFAARAAEGGRFLLRIEDIDATRARPEFVTAIERDLAWLGLTWETPVRVQSRNFADYAGALARLNAQGLLYPCFCTRKEIAAEIAASGKAPQGPDGPLYPGTCRHQSVDEQEARMAASKAYAWRLDMGHAVAMTGPLTLVESDETLAAAPQAFGDVVLARKDTPASYHLAVVVDDAAQGVTLVTRGDDLRPAAHLHRLLQALLDLPVPEWRHHRLILDERGERLAKRDHATALEELRARGVSPADLRAEFGFA
jgi:glutamyl-Q tRNA(Asp) synthetase